MKMNQAQTEVKNRERASFLKKFLIVNFVWLMVLIFISDIYEQLLFRIPVARDAIRTIPWYKGFLISLVPFLIIQGILHWFTLRHFFPKKTVNIAAVLVMPFLILLGYAWFLAWLFARAVEGGALD